MADNTPPAEWVDLQQLAEQQSALRRVATIVAQGAEPDAVFGAVVEEAPRLLGVSAISLWRWEAEGQLFTLMATTRRGDSLVSVGSTMPLSASPIGGLVVGNGQSVRVDDWSAFATTMGRRPPGRLGPAVAAAVLVEGETWGVLSAFADQGQDLPAWAERQLVDFTDLLGIAIANARVRDQLRALASEHGAALRRVATLVAERAPSSTTFDSVAEEASRALGVARVIVARPDVRGAVHIVGQAGALEPPDRNRVYGPGQLPTVTRVLATGAAARIDDWSGIPGPVAEMALRNDWGTGLAAPITVEGDLWGVIMLSSDHSLPPDAETRLTDFTHLVAGFISNLQARDDLRMLADEQRGLRRVATLVAQESSPERVFRAVAEELRGLMACNDARLIRYEDERELVIVDRVGVMGDDPAVGTRMPLDGDHPGARVFVSGRPERAMSVEAISDGAMREIIARHPFRGAIFAPITIEGQIWGALGAIWIGVEPPIEDPEHWLTGFTDLLALSVANAESRRKLIASRIRVVNASDETRRRIERNLHDGVQQRLVALGLRLRTLAAPDEVSETLREDLGQVTEDLEDVLEEIRVFSQGLHPLILARAGLGPSLRTLARRSPIPVELAALPAERFPASIETAVYYAVSESLANVAKHSGAAMVRVSVTAEPNRITVAVVDDGSGGALISEGTGLIGLVDRVEALGGRLALSSPPGEGTTVRIELPLIDDEDDGTRPQRAHTVV